MKLHWISEVRKWTFRFQQVTFSYERNRRQKKLDIQNWSELWRSYLNFRCKRFFLFHLIATISFVKQVFPRKLLRSLWCVCVGGAWKISKVLWFNRWLRYCSLFHLEITKKICGQHREEQGRIISTSRKVYKNSCCKSRRWVQFCGTNLLIFSTRIDTTVYVTTRYCFVFNEKVMMKFNVVDFLIEKFFGTTGKGI